MVILVSDLNYILAEEFHDRLKMFWSQDVDRIFVKSFEILPNF